MGMVLSVIYLNFTSSQKQLNELQITQGINEKGESTMVFQYILKGVQSTMGIHSWTVNSALW